MAAARRELGDDGRRQAMIRIAHGHVFRIVGAIAHAHPGRAHAEDITASLSRMRWPCVASFQSGPDLGPDGSEKAARLGVRYLVGGRTRRAGLG